MTAPHALEITELRFAYRQGSSLPELPAGTWSLNVPSLRLDPGEQMLLTGGSGSGKSTLLQLIAGLIDLSGPGARGRIVVAGTDVHALRGARRDLFRGGHLGMIFQTFNLLHGFSAVENVLAALKFSGIPAGEHRGRAGLLLERLGIERQDSPPEELSVGQQQRVAVARALACDPVLVLADEPTASLDPENAAAAMELIQTACREKGAALLCVSHDPAMAERFPGRASIAELASGRAMATDNRQS